MQWFEVSFKDFPDKAESPEEAVENVLRFIMYGNPVSAVVVDEDGNETEWDVQDGVVGPPQ